MRVEFLSAIHCGRTALVREVQMAGYLRGQIAKMAHINFETLRYYEKNGLIFPERTAAGYRIYSEDVLTILEFIKNAKEAGMTLAEIRRLFTVDSQSDNQTRIARLLETKIATIDSKIAELIKMKAALRQARDLMEQRGLCPVLEKHIGIAKKRL